MSSENFSDKNIVDLCKFVCTHPIIDLSFRFNYCSNRDKEDKGKRGSCFCPFHEEFKPLFNPFFANRPLSEVNVPPNHIKWFSMTLINSDNIVKMFGIGDIKYYSCF